MRDSTACSSSGHSPDVYCRPICPAKDAKEGHAASSTRAAGGAGGSGLPAGRPELAPGSAPVDDAQRVAHLIVQRLEEGNLDAEAGLEAIAGQFELSSRQIRRIVRSELGGRADPVAADARAPARQAAADRDGPAITEVDFASGFSSLRRFQ